jgi:hypothetical protein
MFAIIELKHRYEQGLERKDDIAKRMANLRARVRELLGRVALIEERAETTPPADHHGGDRRSEEARDQEDNIILKSKCGTSADYLTARIARDRPDILERMKAGGGGGPPSGRSLTAGRVGGLATARFCVRRWRGTERPDEKE